MRTRFNQYGSVIHPRILHKLLGQDFPLWAALQVYTFPQRETTKLLHLKSAMARYGGTSDDEGQREAQTAESGLQSVREMVLRGEALHAVNLYVVVDAPDMRTLNTRIEITRGSIGLEMERVYGAGDLVPRLFSTDLSGAGASEGIPMTTSGAALLGGSALSYRRRTQTKGVMIGIDRNQSPVVINIFDDAAPRKPYCDCIPIRHMLHVKARLSSLHRSVIVLNHDFLDGRITLIGHAPNQGHPVIL